MAIKRESEEYLNRFLALKNNFEVSPEVLSFELMTRPVDDNLDLGCRDIGVSTAYQCYSPGVTGLKLRLDEKAQSTADDTIDGGHHTTRMHTYYTWKLKVTRNVIQGFFNEGEYYNASQQSQRYALVTERNYLVPTGLSEEQRGLFLETADMANRAYFELLEKLKPKVVERLKGIDMFRGEGENRVSQRQNKAGKIGQEVARYVLPIDQFSVMDYTINELQLLRLFRASMLPNVSNEAKYIVAKMIEMVAQKDSQILEDLRKPVEIDDNFSEGVEFIGQLKEMFDKKLDGGRTKLIGFDLNSRDNLIFSGRMSMGALSVRLTDEEVLKRIMDPSENRLLGDVFETGLVDPITRTLKTVHLTYADKLSHTADSQRQRQRTTPGATPPLVTQFDGTVDCAVPMLIEQDPELKEWYEKKLESIVKNVNKCIKKGISREIAISLLPNSYNLRLVETGDLLSFFHRRKSRLCFNAQEEIFQIDREQTLQTIAVFPETRQLFQAPCGIRKVSGETPYCPESSRFCGQRVWTLDNVSDYQRIY